MKRFREANDPYADKRAEAAAKRRKVAYTRAISGLPPRVGYTTVARSRGVYATGEMKYFDGAKVASTINANSDWSGAMQDLATFNCLFCPVKGTSISERIGQKVKVYKIKIRGFIQKAAQINQTFADNGTTVRLLLVQDTQTNSTQMAASDVMTAATAVVDLVTVFQNVNNFGRFRVIKDKIINIQNPSISYDGTNIEQSGLQDTFYFSHVPKEPIEVKFNAVNGGSIADIVDNSFHMIAVSTLADATLTYNVRVCYKD
uniref:hypothetical protein n=1 Tax=Rheinheimera sp. TaxID=1869214 RepID=UPI0040486613